MSNTVSSYSVATQKRAYALDALRGLAILAMVLSGNIPEKGFPAWMHHAQVPPPTFIFNPNLPGLTWVDLVFPFFLFSMGAAIPLALSRRLAKGWSKSRIFFYILKRGFLLGTFAIVLQHIRPLRLNPHPNWQTWLIALLGFLILFLIYVRWPKSWKLSKYENTIKISAWFSITILLALLHYPNGSGFSVERSDIILVLLTTSYVFGSIVWLFTKSNRLLRLGCLSLLFALRLSACIGTQTCDSTNWISWLWSSSPVPWIFKVEYIQYLFLVIPGTIAGDLILDWMQTPTTTSEIDLEMRDDTSLSHSRKYRYFSILVLMLCLGFSLLIGLQARWIWQTTLLSAVLCSMGWFLFVKPANETEELLKNFYQWGVYWMILGLFFEPFEVGIKKDPPTMSYYFVSAGIALFTLIIFTLIIDILKKRKWLQLLIDNGQNPMLAYIGLANLILPILNLTQLQPLIVSFTKTPLLEFIRGIIYTCLLTYIVRFFTRRKLFWRT